MNQINQLDRHSHRHEIAGNTLRMRAKSSAFGSLTLVGRTALLILSIHAAGCDDKNKDKTQTTPAAPATQPAQPAVTTPPAPKPDAKPLTTLESLVAPVALYPDPLLAEVLVAATYPLEVVQAARWLETKPDPATLRTKNWDASISRLTAVPDVIAMMDRHLDWTTQLGDAFLSDPKQLMDAIQSLRKRAIDAGFLKDSDLQQVETKTVSTAESGADEQAAGDVKVTPAVLTRDVITIKPAKADTLSVPSYNPEVVYSAPMAPPPSASAYPAGIMAAAPAASYYPTYVQPVTTTTNTSNNDQWMSFGAGALVGGLLTWGIMEWADDDDDWDDHYHVSHYYGDSVCHGGNCWHGGGGGYYGGSRYGNANVNRGNINISGNEININRDGTFKPDQLPALKDRTNRWQPDARHRRGQAYPPQAQQRIGRAETPALAGSRLSGAQSLPADMRGFGQTNVADRSSLTRPSSADVRQHLAAKPSRQSRPGKAQNESQPVSSRRENALEELQASGQRSKVESQRGASSLSSRQQTGKTRAKDRSGPASSRSEGIAAGSQKRSQQTVQRSGQQQQLARQRNEQTQRLQQQRRQEMARPNAFDGARDGDRVAAYSNRGNASFNRASGSVPRTQPARQSLSTSGQRGAFRGGGAARGSGGGRRR